MAITQIQGISNTFITDFPVYTVSIKKNWADDWQTVDYLQPLTVTQTASPTIPKAQFLYLYGDIKHEDEKAFSWCSPLSILDYYVKVELTDSDGNQQMLFCGLLSDDEFEIYGSAADGSPQGNQTITAYGLEHLLDRKSIYGAYCDDYVFIHHTPPFNQRQTWGNVLSGNRSTSQLAAEEEGQLSSYVFSSDGDVWTYLDIITYVLRFYAPEGLTFDLTGHFFILDQLSGEFDFEGLTIRQVLEKLIDRRRGLGWALWTDGVNNINIDIYTTFTADVNVNGVTYPASSYQQTLDFGSYTDIEDARFATSRAQLYDKVIVQGARVKSCFNLSFADDTLQKAWSDTEQTDYDDADDAARKLDIHDAVYQRFTIKDAWDWKAGNAGPDVTGQDRVYYPVSPLFDDNAQLLVDEDGNIQSAEYFNSGKPLLRRLPLAREDGTDKDNYLPPLAIISEADPDDATKSIYYAVDQLAKSDKTPASLKMLDGDSGCQLSCRHNHSFGLNSFNGSSDYSPEFDYNDLIFVVAIETDNRPQVVVEFISEIETSRTLIINVPDAEYWYITPNTIKSVKNNALVYHTGGTVRDDTDKLRNIAELARAWYGNYRGIMRLTVKDVFTTFFPGVLITTVTSGNQTEYVNTVVSSITYDCRSGKTSIETGYSELDFQVILDIPGMSDFRSVGRAFNKQKAAIEDIRRHVSNLPVRLISDDLRTEKSSVIPDMDFIVDMFDRADSDDLGKYWGLGSANFAIRNGHAWPVDGSMSSTSLFSITRVFEALPYGYEDRYNNINYKLIEKRYYENNLITAKKPELSQRTEYVAAKLATKKNFSIKIKFNVPSIKTGENSQSTSSGFFNSWQVTDGSLGGYPGDGGFYEYTNIYNKTQKQFPFGLLFNGRYVAGVDESGNETKKFFSDGFYGVISIINDKSFAIDSSSVSATATASIKFNTGEMQGNTYTASATVNISAFGFNYDFVGGTFFESFYTSNDVYVDDYNNRIVINYDKDFFNEEREVSTSTEYYLKAANNDDIFASNRDISSDYGFPAGFWYAEYLQSRIDLYASCRLKSDYGKLKPADIVGNFDQEKELLVTVDSDFVTVYLDGVEVEKGANPTASYGGIVGMSSTSRMIDYFINNQLESYSAGIKAFKVWNSEIPEPNDESGHGKYIAGETEATSYYQYRDGYHTQSGTDETTGLPTYTYTPTALD